MPVHRSDAGQGRLAWPDQPSCSSDDDGDRTSSCAQPQRPAGRTKHLPVFTSQPVHMRRLQLTVLTAGLLCCLAWPGAEAAWQQNLQPIVQASTLRKSLFFTNLAFDLSAISS